MALVGRDVKLPSHELYFSEELKYEIANTVIITKSRVTANPIMVSN
jgi:hypothetical protein